MENVMKIVPVIRSRDLQRSLHFYTEVLDFERKWPAADPNVYYVTDHYLNYTAVLARLSRVTPDALRDLLGMAHKFVTAHEARRSPSRNRRKPV
jgi:catechol 2,3-dioxygenase-like lactoylglutathione lyase family enzyme